MPLAVPELIDEEGPPREIREELSYDVAALAEQGERRYQLLNNLQQEVVDSVLRAIENRQSRCFFIDGPGGTGKTYLYNTLLAIARSRGTCFTSYLTLSV